MSKMDKPSVGIAVAVFNPKGEILLGKRMSSHGAGTWAMPGGHLEMWESPEECAKRELLEETGIVLEKDPWLVYVSNDYYNQGEPSGKHYITLFMACVVDQEPKLIEPEKCEGWHWFSLSDPKEYEPLFASTSQLIGENTLFYYFQQQLQKFRSFLASVGPVSEGFVKSSQRTDFEKYFIGNIG